MIAEEVDHRSGQLDALGEVDAAEDTPHLGVLDRRVLERRRHGAADVVDLPREAHEPVRQPAVAGFERRGAESRVPVEHAAHQHERQEPLDPPHVWPAHRLMAGFSQTSR